MTKYRSKKDKLFRRYSRSKNKGEIKEGDYNKDLSNKYYIATNLRKDNLMESDRDRW